MTAGSLQTVLVCTPVDVANTSQQSICPKVGVQFFAPTPLQAYLLNPTQQNNIDAALGAFDYAYAGGLWAMAFSMVVGLYFVSHGIGQVLGMIRRG